jgi:putative colanic acid biosynthesis acetyltransferase WcaF
MDGVHSYVNAVIKNANPKTGPSFTLKNRLGRVLWAFIYLALFRLSPRPCHGWRRFILRLFGARVGSNVHVYPSVKIWAPWNLVLDDNAGIGDGANCYSMATIHIGKDAVISQGAHLCTGSHDYESPNFQLYATPIVIGARAWICAETFVCPGVTVGEGSVVGARSVVTKDLPPWMVCAGNPCKPLKPRDIRE